MSYDAIPSLDAAANSLGVSPFLIEIDEDNSRKIIIDRDDVRAAILNLDYWRQLYGTTVLAIQVKRQFMHTELEIEPATVILDYELIVAPRELQLDFNMSANYIVLPEKQFNDGITVYDCIDAPVHISSRRAIELTRHLGVNFLHDWNGRGRGRYLRDEPSPFLVGSIPLLANEKRNFVNQSPDFSSIEPYATDIKVNYNSVTIELREQLKLPIHIDVYAIAAAIAPVESAIVVIPNDKTLKLKRYFGEAIDRASSDGMISSSKTVLFTNNTPEGPWNYFLVAGMTYTNWIPMDTIHAIERETHIPLRRAAAYVTSLSSDDEDVKCYEVCKIYRNGIHTSSNGDCIHIMPHGSLHYHHKSGRFTIGL